LNKIEYDLHPREIQGKGAGEERTEGFLLKKRKEGKRFRKFHDGHV